MICQMFIKTLPLVRFCRCYALDFRIHFADQHIKNHFIIGNKRPERIFESRGFVVFDVEMREPSEAVSDDQTQWKIKPSAALDNPDEQCEAEHRADKMQIACQRSAVFGNVKVPKLFVIGDSFFHLFRNLAVLFTDYFSRLFGKLIAGFLKRSPINRQTFFFDRRFAFGFDGKRIFVDFNFA